MIEQQEEVIHALLAPVLEVWDGVLAVPLVGELDDLRAAAITEVLLARVAGGRCQFVILDLTGVELVDARTADMLVRIVQSVRLLGAKTIVTGIRPRVAQALVAAGAELGGIVTRANLREGLRYCLASRPPTARGALS
jgi:rsbT co-antagonist protein RsbR